MRGSNTFSSLLGLCLFFMSNQSPGQNDQWQRTVQSPEKVFFVSIVYQQNLKPNLLIGSVEIKNGFHPSKVILERGHRIFLISATGQRLFETSFEMATDLPGELPNAEGPNSSVSYKRNHWKQSLTLPFFENAARIEIRTRAGQLLSFFPLSNHIPSTENDVSFRTAPGEKIISSRDSTVDNGDDPEITVLQDDSRIDFTYIGHGYQDLELFHQDVDRFSANLLQYEPFRSYANRINFHYVDYQGSLGCAHSGRLLLCDTNKAAVLISEAGVPTDKIVIIVNTPEYGGSGGRDAAISYNGAPGYPHGGEQVFVHELGHSLGDLMDEYISGNAWGTGNCYGGTIPNSGWPSIPPNSYHLGCSLTSLYRSSASSVMLELETRSFNKVSIDQLKKAIQAYTGYIDTTPPSTPIIRTIGQSLYQKLRSLGWSASTDDVAVAGYRIFRNRVHIGNSLIPSFTDTTIRSFSIYAYQVQAYDNAGNLSALSPPYWIWVGLR